MKSIHVELADKRQEVVVFEVLREDLRCQARDILHNKRVAFRSPTNDILIVGILNEQKGTSTMR